MFHLVYVLALVPMLAWTSDFIVRNPWDATFRVGTINGPVYQALGTSLYPYWAGTLADYSRRMILYGKANGITTYRAILIYEQINRNPDTSTCFMQNSFWLSLTHVGW